MSLGPQPMTRAERLVLAREIAARARASRGDVLAVGAYGSLARGEDGPYSDSEILCVLGSPGLDYTNEWTTGPWKAEVNFRSRDVVLTEAAEVHGDWALTHGIYLHLLPFYDPDRFFPLLREVVLGQPEEKFRAAMRELIVGDLYELVGKLRNAREREETEVLPLLAMHLALYGAFLVGLGNRRPFTSGTRALVESLALPARPPGYDALASLAIQGKLDQPRRIHEAGEGFWSGVECWAAAHGISIAESQRIPF